MLIRMGVFDFATGTASEQEHKVTRMGEQIDTYGQSNEDQKSANCVRIPTEAISHVYGGFTEGAMFCAIKSSCHNSFSFLRLKDEPVVYIESYTEASRRPCAHLLGRWGLRERRHSPVHVCWISCHQRSVPSSHREEVVRGNNHQD